MPKNKKDEKIMNKIIEIIIDKKEKAEGSEENKKQIKEMTEQIEKEENRAMELQKNIEFFKTTLVSAEALKKVIKLATEEGREIDLISMSEILIGTLVVLEEKGFVKVIEKN